jgi:hypothetical protein
VAPASSASAATIVDGLPIYGDRTFLEQFGLELQSLPRREGSAVANKAVHLPASAGVDDFDAAITELEDQLKELDPPTLRSNLLADSDVHYGGDCVRIVFERRKLLPW